MRAAQASHCRNLLFRQPRAPQVLVGFAAISLLALSGGRSNVSFAAPAAKPPADLSISSASFANGGGMAKKFTCSGVDVSPQLSWTEPPAGTKTFALLVNDPDAPAGNWNHWAIWNLPSRARALPEGVERSENLPDGSQQGLNDFRKLGYNGPCPPANKTHHYHFKLYAVDMRLNLKKDAGRPELEAAMKGHILAQAEWIGTFHR